VVRPPGRVVHALGLLTLIDTLERALSALVASTYALGRALQSALNLRPAPVERSTEARKRAFGSRPRDQEDVNEKLPRVTFTGAR
jgi:hypothetical protein